MEYFVQITYSGGIVLEGPYPSRAEAEDVVKERQSLQCAQLGQAVDEDGDEEGRYVHFCVIPDEDDDW